MSSSHKSYEGVSASMQLPFIVTILFGLVSLLVYLVMVPDVSGDLTTGSGGMLENPKHRSFNIQHKSHPRIYRDKLHKVEDGLRSTVKHKREELAKALQSLSKDGNGLPARLQTLRDRNEIVGEKLRDIKEGKETVQEILEAARATNSADNDESPIELQDTVDFLHGWIRGLHRVLKHVRKGTHRQIWQAYHDYTVKTLYVWDREYLSKMPPRRNDGSIFLSIATYRDENCINTLKWAYEKAKHPEKLFVGLVQQNCHKDCISGVLDGGEMEPSEPDQDCYKEFCEGEGKERCENGQVRLLDVNESESLGPYAARFLCSKLWFGEQWYMQIDAHMTFAQDWDAISVDMLQRSPSKKPVITHYPPEHTEDLDAMQSEPSIRICNAEFAVTDIESQVIRLSGAEDYGSNFNAIPRFAPFTAAGYFVAHSDFLREVPFDPFLPWIFMGEEIIMSSRLWTAGYDIFAPSQSVVGHMYERAHQPKFWETVGRVFSPSIDTPLEMLVVQRVNYQLGYPEAAKDMLPAKSLLTAVEQYSMGTERPLSQYLIMAGLDMSKKEVTPNTWCENGLPPPGFEEFNHLYES